MQGNTYATFKKQSQKMLVIRKLLLLVQDSFIITAITERGSTDY